MKKSAALTRTTVSGPARRAGASNRQSLISVAEPRLIAARRLADDLAATVLPDDPAEYPALLATLTTENFADAITMLESALNQTAKPDELRALVVLMLDGLGQKAGTTAKSRITAHMIALQAAEVLIDGETASEPISAMVIAATIARIFRRSKKAPLPCELLAACMDTRKAVAKLLEWLQEVEHFGGHMRLELEWLIAKGQPGYDGKLDTDDRIPVFENRVTQ